MRTSPSFIFRKLLPELPRGTPLGTDWLLENGITPKQASRLVGSGWLTRLGRGVYLLPGDQLDRDACLAYLCKSFPNLHVAGKTALAWRGVRHNLSIQESLTLWGEKSGNLPTWFTKAFPAHYQATHIFDDSMPITLGLSPLHSGNANVLVSGPERALLELLSDVGKRQGMEEAGNLVEGIRSPRLSLMDDLFTHVNRIKIVRLAYLLAEKLELPWKDIAYRHCERLGGGHRWASLGKTGERINLKRPA